MSEQWNITVQFSPQLRTDGELVRVTVTQRRGDDEEQVLLTAEQAQSLAAQLNTRFAQSESEPITAEDKRWRFLEHGCQFVSWTPTGGETVSFDPRDVKHLSAMREKADKTLSEQVAQLRAEAEELERRWKR